MGGQQRMIATDVTRIADTLEFARTKVHRILVALESKGDPLAALAVARLISQALHVPLHGLFAWHLPLPASEVPRVLGVDPEALDGMVIDVEVGDVVECLARAARAEPTSILVISADATEGSADALGLGEVAARTLSESLCGVVIVRPGMARPLRIARILLPLDGTPSTAAPSAQSGRWRGTSPPSSRIVVVAEAHPGATSEPGSMRPPLYMDQPQHEWAAYASEFPRAIRPSDRPYPRHRRDAPLPRCGGTRRARSCASGATSRPISPSSCGTGISTSITAKCFAACSRDRGARCSSSGANE